MKPFTKHSCVQSIFAARSSAMLMILLCFILNTTAQNSTTASLVPVLPKFDALSMDNKYVLVHWTMVHENNSCLFTIERSLDGNKFVPVGDVVSDEQSYGTINYSFIDENPLNGVSYYRVKKTDADKNVSYTTPVLVTINKLQFKVFPNPATVSQNITIEFSNVQNQEVVVQLFDMAGKRVIKKNVMMNETQNGLSMPLGDLTPGMYTMTFSGNNFFEKQNLTVDNSPGW